MRFLIWQGPLDPKGQMKVVGRFDDEKRSIDMASAIAETSPELIQVRDEENWGKLLWSSLPSRVQIAR